jgi:hypothetical protein
LYFIICVRVINSLLFLGIRSNNIWPTDIWPTDIWPTDIWPTDIWPTDIWPTDIWSTQSVVPTNQLMTKFQCHRSGKCRANVFWPKDTEPSLKCICAKISCLVLKKTVLEPVFTEHCSLFCYRYSLLYSRKMDTMTILIKALLITTSLITLKNATLHIGLLYTGIMKVNYK